MIRAIRAALAFSAVIVAGSPAVAQAQTSAALPKDSVKTALLRQVLVQTRAADLALLSMEQSVKAQRVANPRIPAVFWDRFLAEARASKGELEAMIIAIYDRKFTTNEIRELTTFYDSPLGRKMLAEMPAIMQESMAAGQQWGSRIGAEIGKQLAAEGVRIEP